MSTKPDVLFLNVTLVLLAVIQLGPFCVRPFVLLTKEKTAPKVPWSNVVPSGMVTWSLGDIFKP